MDYTLILPTDYDASKKYALIIGLHGMNGKASNVAGGFAPLTREGFVVCAPQSSRQGWDQPNVEKAKAVLTHLIDVLSIDEKKLHGVAYSQGCGFLAPIVFDKRFHFISASWSMGGSSGGKVPRHAKKGMGAIALVGSEDWARGAAEGTVSQLEKKVRNVECHVQMGLGHEYPAKLAPYHQWWLKVMNGWFEPGNEAFFDWTDDVAGAKARMAAEKRGGFLWFYAKDDEGEEARRVQREVFFDPFVRHFGREAVAVKQEKSAKLFAELELTETPAVVVTKQGFEVVKVLSGKKLTAKALAKELRKVVPAKARAMPKQPGVFLHR
jgi:hypothetical protein